MTASFAEQEIWHVMISADDMKRMNVDQLDDAYRLDLVDSSTLVWKDGMSKWRRLGSIAGIDEEPETIARPPARTVGPPSPPPPPRPRPEARALAATRPVTANPFASVPTAVNPFAATTPYTSNTPAAVFAAPQLVAPAPRLVAPDPYVLPKRRVSVPSEVDFRRASRGVRWGRWLFAFVLLTGGVLAAYRQNYLREGARRIGLENKYLYGEKRVTGWVTAKTPSPIQAALRQLKLLPGPNAVEPTAAAASMLAATTPAQASPATEPAPTQATPPAAQPSEVPATDPNLKTVSLESLPVLSGESAASGEATEPATPPRAAPQSASKPVASKPVTSKPVAKAATPKKTSATKAVAAKAEPKSASRAAPKLPPPSANEGFLKAAIRQAIVADSTKKK